MDTTPASVAEPATSAEAELTNATPAVELASAPETLLRCPRTKAAVIRVTELTRTLSRIRGACTHTQQHRAQVVCKLTHGPTMWAFIA